MRRILVTGAGGIGGVNFVRALRSVEKFYIVGTDHFPFHIKFNDLDKEYISPRHDDPRFIELIREIVEREKIEFIHPQPEVEAEVIARYKGQLKAKTFLPRAELFDVCRDKYKTAKKLEPLGLAPRTILYSQADLQTVFEEMGGRIWVRARRGAGGRLSLLCENERQLRLWVQLWIEKGKAREEDFIIQEYLPGRDYAWDSLWFNGELVTSYARERLEYIFPHLSPSGITGTPTVSRIVHNDEINRVAVEAVKTIDSKPHGFICLDLKEGGDGRIYVTEINLKAHTTLALWAYVASKYLKLPKWSNMSYLYVKIALDGMVNEDIPKYDIYPENTILLRHIDVGVKVITNNGEMIRVQI